MVPCQPADHQRAQWSEPVRVPIRGEIAGDSADEGTGYEIDFTFKNRHDIPAGAGRRETAVAAHSAIAPRRTGDSPRTWIRLDFRHCPSCWAIERKIGLLRRPASPRTDKIVGGNLWVGGKYFVDWFNQDFAPHHVRGPNKAGFSRGSLPYRNTFLHWYQHCAELWSTELSVAQFAVMFAITYNESTGFLPRSEGGNLAYFFEYRRKPDNSRRKNSYNRYGFAPGPAGVERVPGHHANRKAGDQLRSWWNDTTGKGAQMRADGLTEAALQFDVWNGVWWKDRPSPPAYVDGPPTAVCPTYGDLAPNANLEDNPALARWVRQCDFNKLRGRGMMQSTGRPHFINEIRPALHAAGYADFDDLTDDELDNAVMRDVRVSLETFRLALRNIDANHGNAMTRLGSEVSDALFGEVGAGYSGGSGTAKVRWRSRQLHDAIVAAGWECRPLSDSGLAQIRAGGSDTDGIRAMQTILDDLGYPGTASGTFDAESGERLHQFETFFAIQGTAAQRLTLDSATQLIKWHEARRGRGVHTSPTVTTAHPPVEAAPAEVHAPAMAEELTEPEEAEPEPDEPAAAGPTDDDDDAADSRAEEQAAEPPPEPEPMVTEATHDEHDEIAVEAFLVSHAMTDCEDLERVARDPGFRRGDGEPLFPGDARATSAAITALQTALRALGYDLGTGGAASDGIDGRWSARGRTVRAIQQHQRARGPAWAAARDPNVRGPVRTDGRTDWITLYIIDRDALVAEDAATAAAAASSTPVVVAPRTSSESVESRPETGRAADRPARSMTRREALELITALNESDGVGFQILDPDHGGTSGYGDYPDCRVRLPSPCYGVVLRTPGWSRTQIDPRLAVGVARLCRWLHDRGVIGVLQHESTGGFLGNADRGGGPHGHGCAFDLSSFDFDADHAAADPPRRDAPRDPERRPVASLRRPAVSLRWRPRLDHRRLALRHRCAPPPLAHRDPARDALGPPEWTAHVTCDLSYRRRDGAVRAPASTRRRILGHAGPRRRRSRRARAVPGREPPPDVHPTDARQHRAAVRQLHRRPLRVRAARVQGQRDGGRRLRPQRDGRARDLQGPGQSMSPTARPRLRARWRDGQSRRRCGASGAIRAPGSSAPRGAGHPSGATDGALNGARETLASGRASSGSWLPARRPRRSCRPSTP